MDKLTIHNIRKEFFELDLSEYQLTFDDGLYAHYYYFPLFESNPNHFAFFIITGFIQPGKARKIFDGQYLPYLKSRQYMYQAYVENKFDQFMRLEELEVLTEKNNVIIGAHSHFHDIVLTDHPPKKPLSQWKLQRLPCSLQSKHGAPMNRRSKLAYQGYHCSKDFLVERKKTEWIDYIKYDTETCLNWFLKYLGFQPSIYCFPFNEYTPELLEILKSFGFKQFYNGRSGDNKQIFRRMDIDILLK